MSFAIQYHPAVIAQDIPKLSTTVRAQIRRAIETRLTTNPEVYGKPLRRSLRGYLKIRVGDYRVIYRIERGVVKVFVIQHRSVVYERGSKRIQS